MNILKMGPLLALTVTFGLTACSDSSSSDNSCQVLSQDPLVIESIQQGNKTETTLILKDNKVIETIKADQNIPDDVCMLYKNDSDYGHVDCTGNTITATSKESYSESDFASLKKQFIHQY